MSNARNSGSRKITSVEVRQWFGSSSKAKLHNPQYRKIASHLTKLHWPGDPPPPADSPWLATINTEIDDRWWDFQAATAAAKTLRDSFPKMLAFQEGLQWAPETRDGLGAIKQLQASLVVAIPYIEWPFGYYKRATGYKPPKAWHTYASLVARLVIQEMVVAGHAEPGITRNSIVVRVVRKALIRMTIPYAKTVSNTAIGAYLTRWDKKYGLTPKTIEALTTKAALRSL
jgi:hypothetical protein